MTESELVMRLNRLEGQVRQLTGMVEQLQLRNSQLEQQLARAQPGGAPPRRSRARRCSRAPPRRNRNMRRRRRKPIRRSRATRRKPIRRNKAIRSRTPIRPAPPPAGGRRGDAFDPNQNPNAPGVPRTLGGPGNRRGRAAARWRG